MADKLTETVELKLCPFCGAPAHLIEGHRDHWRAQCSKCGASIGEFFANRSRREDQRLASEAWNARAALTPAGEDEIERVAAAIGAIPVNMSMTIAGIIADGSPNADLSEILRDAALAALSRPNVDEMREALSDLEQRATAALSAMDRYNEKNGTHIIGPSLLQLGKSIAHARAALNGSGNHG